MKEDIHVEHHTLPRLAPSRVRRVSWGAIFAGLFVTITVQLALTLLGAGIGASTVDPLREQNPGQGLAVGSAIWLGLSGLISVWLGACVAGRLSGGPARSDGMLHGVVTWSVSTVTMVLLLATTVGSMLGGAGALLGNAVSQGSRQGSSSDAVSDQVRNIFPQAGALLPPTGRTEGQPVPGQLTELAQRDSELAAALGRMTKNGGAAQSPQDRDQVVNLLSTKHSMPQAQAQSLVAQWDQQFQQLQSQASQKAREVGDTAARGVAQGALWGFGALLLGLLAAAWGGWVGTASLPRPTEAATVTTT